jgi:hypothetical protein
MTKISPNPNPFYLNYDLLKNMNHKQNMAGSDDNIINILCENGFKLYNPCFEIILVHLHFSDYRTYDSTKKITAGKYFIKQEYLIKDNYNDDDFIFYHGLDYPENDIYKKSSSIKELKELCKNDKNCIGFNTFGFFNNKIDILNLVKTPYINKNTEHGIFVKKNMVI